MNCPTIELSEYLDGALAPDRAARIERHVADCEECRAHVTEERKLRKGLLVLACPNAEVLGRFLDGSLHDRVFSGVKEHVARCEECANVVEWTREAAVSLESGELPKASTSGRRRRALIAGRGPKRSNILQLAIPLAAAAALILAVLVITHEPAKPVDDAPIATDKTPKPPQPPTQPPRPPKPPEKTPPPPPPVKKPDGDKPVPPDETPPPPPAPDVPPPPQPDVPKPDEPEKTPPPPPVRPGEVERPDKPKEPPPRPIEGAVAIQRAGGDLKVGPSRDKATKVSGNASISPRDLLFASMAPGRFEMPDGPIVLGPATDARLDATRLTLEKGEAWSESGLELTSHGATARPDGAGAQLLLRATPRGGQLFVYSGKAVFSSSGGQVSVSAGEASEIESDAAPTKPHKAEPATWVADARAERTATLGLDYPRGFLADEAARSLKDALAAGSIRDQARALHAIEAARASDERFARVVSENTGAAADAAFDRIVREADALAAPEAALAVLARSRRLPAQKDALAKLFLALGKTVEKASVTELDSLAKDAGALLALKPFERAGVRPKGLRERVLAEPLGAEDDADWLARATLAGAALAPLDVDSRFKKLDGSLGKDGVVPENRLAPLALLAYERAQAAAGKPADDERRFWDVLEHLAAAGPKPCAGANAVSTLLVLSREAHILAGRGPIAPPPASVTILPRKDGRLEVTIAIDSAKRPRAVHLGGSWDSWRTDKPNMTRRRDGTFVETLLLPRGRYVYKVQLVESGLWEPDARNPLHEYDGKSGDNSVLMLEE
ncbi:MAG: zf-HC2 domain-containing protein [Planctomycetota bacterium]